MSRQKFFLKKVRIVAGRRSELLGGDENNGGHAGKGRTPAAVLALQVIHLCLATV